MRTHFFLLVVLSTSVCVGIIAAESSKSQPATPSLALEVHQPTSTTEQAEVSERMDVSSQALSLLSDRCFACHGPDNQAREADLRLDRFEDATRPLSSGQHAIVPGQVSVSEMMVRLTSKDPDLRMPPLDSRKPLTEKEIELLAKWIGQGADYETHWSFAPVRNQVPPIEFQNDWCRNAIDVFVAQQLHSNALTPSTSSDPRTLIRRVSLDLIGLPPSNEALEQLLENWSPETYEAYVDQLLAKPEYGQHMAIAWLDAARYADTNGYQHDNSRDMWAWRDWVVNALNYNMPFDQFTIEQIAGDLIPNSTSEQRIATGFNRNHGLNFEGGSIAAESQFDYVVDRTNTFGTVWLGLTVGCAQCHDHKYDPISQRDYYGLYAFFNNIDENGFAGEEGNAAPKMPVSWPEHDQQLALLEGRLSELQSEIGRKLSNYDSQQQSWEDAIRNGSVSLPDYPSDTLLEIDFDGTSGQDLPVSQGSQPLPLAIDGRLDYVEGHTQQALQFDAKTRLNCGDVGGFGTDDSFSFGAWVYADKQQVAPIMGRSHFHGYDLVWENGYLRANFVNRWDINAVFVKTDKAFATSHWHHVMVTYDGTGKADGVSIYVNGERQPIEVTKDDLTGSIESETLFFLGTRNHQSRENFHGRIDDARVYSRRLSEVEIAQLAGQVRLSEIVQLPLEQRSDAQRRNIREFYLQQNVAEFAEDLAQQSELKRAYYTEKAKQLTSMVMLEMAQPRVTRLLKAGRYDRPDVAIEPHVPDVFPSLDAGTGRPNRLSLAQWLVSGTHPLTARVAVNRAWQQFFGRGIVATPEDFGVQGSLPTHPQLLDWLSIEFVRTGWDVKNLHRLIVTSATYQQSSVMSKTALSLDPENLWLSRFPRRRMAAEVLRDSVLAASDLLDVKTQGPGVMPFQPAGLWEEVSFLSGHTAQEYKPASGSSAHRRSLYTFWKRSCPPPNMKIFDASERAVCTVQRSNTNTPLQALVLMNDPCFVEPALAMAQQASLRFHDDASNAIQSMFLRVLSRNPSEHETHILHKLYSETKSNLSQEMATVLFSSKNIEASIRDSAVGSMQQKDIQAVAALATVAQVIIAMDEAITVN